MLDTYLPDIEALESRGYVVVLKWDGERTRHRRTVLVGKGDHHFRMDADDLESVLREALAWAANRDRDSADA